MPDSKTVFVAGATGAQGAAVVDALEGSGFVIRALVRNPESKAAQRLAARGIELVIGDFEDADSLARGMDGAFAVFSVQTPPQPGDKDSEVRTGRNLVEAARRSGVDLFVHTSVARAGEHEGFVGWSERRWWPGYWLSKAAVNAIVREAGFRRWVILKPAYMMDNFIRPKSAWMFPGLKARGMIESVMPEGARLDLIAAADVGRFAAAAMADPDRFHGEEIPLAADSLTMAQVADAITLATGKAIGVRHVSAEEAIGLGNHAGLTESQQWAGVEGYKVNLVRAGSHGIELERFADWALRMRERFDIGGNA